MFFIGYFGKNGVGIVVKIKGILMNQFNKSLFIICAISFFTCSLSASEIISEREFEKLKKEFSSNLTSFVYRSDNKDRHWGTKVTFSEKNLCKFEAKFYIRSFTPGYGKDRERSDYLDWRHEEGRTAEINLKDINREEQTHSEYHPFFKIHIAEGKKIQQWRSYSKVKADHNFYEDRYMYVDYINLFARTGTEAKLAQNLPLMIDYCRAKQS